MESTTALSDITPRQIAKLKYEQGYPLTIVSERTGIALDELVELQQIEGWQQTDNIPPEVRAELQEAYCEAIPDIVKSHIETQKQWSERAQDIKGTEADFDFAKAIEHAAKGLTLMAQSIKELSLKTPSVIHATSMRPSSVIPRAGDKVGEDS